MVKLPKRKQELLNFLGEGFEVKGIDLEPCIYLDLKKHDVEISGGARSSSKFDIYVWRKDTEKVVKSYYGVHTFEEVRAIMKDIKKRYK